MRHEFVRPELSCSEAKGEFDEGSERASAQAIRTPELYVTT